MRRLISILWLAGPLLACQRQSPTAPPVTAPSSASVALDQMDSRAPVPLLPMMANHQKQNMRDHLVAVQEIVMAAAADDYEGVARAAKRIGYSEEMGKMCTHMGAGAPGFAEQSIRFHHSADRIGDAARIHDRGKVLEELSATLQTCTGCHATWRQQLVDESTWGQRAAVAPPSGHG